MEDREDREEQGTLEEFMEQTPEFTPEQTERRVKSIQKAFRLLMIIAGSMIVLLVISGLLFGGK